MTHTNIINVATMWYQEDPRKKAKGLHLTKFNVLKSVEFNVGDSIKEKESHCWVVEEILSKKQSSMSNYWYIETMCSYI